jgi:hypothetical protein
MYRTQKALPANSSQRWQRTMVRISGGHIRQSAISIIHAGYPLNNKVIYWHAVEESKFVLFIDRLTLFLK